MYGYFYKKVTRFFFIFFAFFCLAFSPLYAASIKVVATTGMVGDMVKAIGGETVNIQTLMGSGVDPHSYRQTRSDVAALTRADIVFSNGLHLEAQLDEILHHLQSQKPVVFLGESFSKEHLIQAEGFSGRYDPHIWMDPALWAKAIPSVRDALSAKAPHLKETFAFNAMVYEEELLDLREEVAALVNKIPDKQRVLVTAHDAFRYFGRAFDVEVVGIQGLSTESEAGLQRIEKLVGLLVEQNIPAVFVESSVSEQNVKALIEGAKAKGKNVRVGGTLFSDAMGHEGTYEGTYLGMIDHNITTLGKALGGNVPEKGLKGKLGQGS